MRVGPLARFEVKFVEGESNDCWLWQACMAPNGYGLFFMGGYIGLTQAHRASWLLYNGPIPEGLFVLHNCPGGDNKACVNPAHLFLGTQATNMEDKVAKGRQAVGEAHGLAKLTERKIMEIRVGRASGISPQVMATFYDVNPTTIYAILSGKIWGHVTGSLDADDAEEVLGILRHHHELFRAEASKRCSAGAAATAAKLREKAAEAAKDTHRTCHGAACLAENADGVVKPVEDFYKDTRRQGAWMKVCKKCFAVRVKESKAKKLKKPNEGRP